MSDFTVKDALATFEKGYSSDIEKVKALGELIGYGNMMSIASVLWRISLRDKYGITSGAFVATISAFLLKKERVRVELEMESKEASFRKRLGLPQTARTGGDGGRNA